MTNAYIAIDLGAGSGRVILGAFDNGSFSFDITGRFANSFRKVNGFDRWDFNALWSGICNGIKKSVELAEVKGYKIRSIGCDTWGVDYGLIDSEGNLADDPISYRDNRTVGIMEQVFRRIDKKKIYSATGIQFMPFNTIFQLYSHVHSPVWSTNPVSLLMMPDIVHYLLSGVMASEYTNATTTQLVNALSGTWHQNFFSELGIPVSIMPKIRKAGDRLGTILPEVNERTGLPLDVEVVLPATHDTGSAVAGTPLEDGWAYLSSGTWSLLGVELDAPCITKESEEGNFTNEGGVFGTTRFLKNITGLWLIESCRREWQNEKVLLPYDDLIARMESIGKVDGEIDPDDPVFINPVSMRSTIDGYLAGRGFSPVIGQAATSRLIFQSLAKKYADVVKGIEKVTGISIKGLNIIGGGSQNRVLNQLTANATRLPVKAGPVEATAIGNLAIQAIAGGRFASLSEARNYISQHIKPVEYIPD